MTPVETLTNYERWMIYMKNAESPEIFLKFGYYFMIGAALQRRVWIPKDNLQCFPNQYLVFVGNPGCGKGRVLVQVKELLSYHKIQKKMDISLLSGTKTQEEVNDATEVLLEQAKKPVDEISLFPTSPDSTTLRNLTHHVAGSLRAIRYKTPEGKTIPYSHCSSCFILEELSSIVKETSETRDLMRFLLVAWDCGNYRHETHTNGKDNITKMCVSLIAGCPPDFAKEKIAEGILEEGIKARTMFVVGKDARQRIWTTGGMTDDQVEAKKLLLAHLLELSKVYGPVHFTEEANEYLKVWHEHERWMPINRINKDPGLDDYYVRKDMHIMKLAMAIHFSDKLDGDITLDEVLKAKALLEEAEPNMHTAVSRKARNTLAPIGVAIRKYLEKFGSKTKQELLFEFITDVREIELDEVLKFLLETRQIKQEMSGNVASYSINVPKKAR